MLVLHAVVPAWPKVVETGGLQVHKAGAVAVLYDETPEAPAPGRDAIIGHGLRIVELAEHGPVLPIRYGTTVASADELATLTGEHADEWTRRLISLRGRCELLVHVQAPDAGPRHPGMSGRDYLRRRVAALQQQDESLDEVRDLVGPWADETRTLPDRTRVAALVDRDDAGAVRDAVTGWAQQRPEVEVAVTGPWPPFSFCEELDPQ
jgi:hypothetical protein